MTIEELLDASIPAPTTRRGSVLVRDATAADLLTAINILTVELDHPDSRLITLLRKLRTKMNRYGAYSVCDLPVRRIVEVLS